jgi:hypothetical protein
MARKRDHTEAQARRLADDLRGVSRLAIGAVTAVTDVVEAREITREIRTSTISERVRD